MTPPDADEPAAAGGDAEAAPADQARCYRHPNREALVRCTRCDRPICPDCMRDAPVGFHCPDDASLAAKSIPVPRTSVGARLLNSPPYVTIALVAANVIVYLVTAKQSVGGFRQPGDGSSSLFTAWQLWPPAIHGHHEYYRLITSAFLHVSVLHIVFNMVALGFIGPPLERLLGPWRFASVYLLGAVGGSAAVYALGRVYTAEVGASGAIFALFAACLVMVRRLPLDPQWLVIVIVANFIFTFSVHNVSKLAHLGGFVTGALAALAIGGLPAARRRLSTATQVGGLLALAAVVIAVVALGDATF
jgi:membrane associated rhomboid family serine protease